MAATARVGVLTGRKSRRFSAAAPLDSLGSMAETVQLSRAAFDRLKSELDDLTTRGRIDIARKIEAARELGDLSENGDYHAAKEEQGKMEGRIIHLTRMVENAEIVEGGDTGGTVAAGSVVGIRYAGDEDVERYLLGSIEEHHSEHEVMSVGSPLGAALMGHTAGDTVSYETPTGAVLEVEIVSVEG
jgi:transcription elongation factor GreA